MSKQSYTITFDTGSAADANRWVGELKNVTLDASPDVEIKQKRDNPHSQDLGTTLVLILGTPAILAVAKALGNWLLQHREVSITIKTSKGELVGQKLSSKDALRLAELMLEHKD